MDPEEEKNHPNRQDDILLRNTIKFLIALLIAAITGMVGAIGGWIWTIAVIQTQMNELKIQIHNNSEYIKKFDVQAGNIKEIRVMLETLVKNSDERNDIMKDTKKIQMFIFGEQKRRKPIINRAEKHMDDPLKHRR